MPGVNSWFTDRKFAGGGALLDLGWHLADVAYAMFTASMTGVTCELTPMANLSASARWRRSTDMATASSARDVEVAGRLTVHFADGGVLRISTGWASEVTYDCTRIRIATPQRSADLQTTFGFSPNRESAPRLVLADGTTSTVHSFENQTGSEYTEQVNAMITAVYQARQGVPRPFGWTHNARAVMNLRSKPMLQREPRCNIGTENISLMGGQPAPSP